MAVYRVDPGYARQVERELVRAGVAVEVQAYGQATYLVVQVGEGPTLDQVDRLIRSRAPKVVLVPDLSDLG